MHKRIVFTGGHAGSTAYAVVEEIKERSLDWKLYFIGSTTAVEGKNVSTYEQKVLPTLDVEFVPITAGRIQRKFSLWTIPSLLKIPLGFFGALYHLAKINPELVLSFGGFVAFPVVVVAKLLGKKVVVHEQTSAVGLANRYSAIFADKIALSRKESQVYFPVHKSVVTGNPVSKEVLSIKRQEGLGSPPLIFVTGGSRGSEILNSVVKALLSKLLVDYKVVHQTGEVQFEEFREVGEDLPSNLRKNYMIYGFMTPSEWKKTLLETDLIVSRAGANITSEIMISRIPAILVPIPFSYLDEQTKNAKVVEEFGLAKIIKQKDISPEVLFQAVEEVFKNREKLLQSTKDKESPDINAASNVVDLLEGLMK